MQSIRNTFKSLVTLVSLCLALGVMPGHTDETVFEFESWKDLEIYFAELGYTEEEWNKGQRVVPPLYVTNMPTRWRGSVSKEVDVRTKI